MQIKFVINQQKKKILVQSGYEYIGDYPRRRTIRWKWVNYEDFKYKVFRATSSAMGLGIIFFISFITINICEFLRSICLSFIYSLGYVVQERKHSHPSDQEKMASTSGVSNFHTNSNPMTTPTPSKTTLSRPIVEFINVVIFIFHYFFSSIWSYRIKIHILKIYLTPYEN